MKPFYSLDGLLGSDSGYELERVNNWLTQQAPLDYLILPDLALLKSGSVLQLSYFPNSPVINEQTSESSYQHLQPFMLRKSLGWVLLDNSNRLIFKNLSVMGVVLCHGTVWMHREALMVSSHLILII